MPFSTSAIKSPQHTSYSCTETSLWGCFQTVRVTSSFPLIFWHVEFAKPSKVLIKLLHLWAFSFSMRQWQSHVSFAGSGPSPSHSESPLTVPAPPPQELVAFPTVAARGAGTVLFALLLPAVPSVCLRDRRKITHHLSVQKAYAVERLPLFSKRIKLFDLTIMCCWFILKDWLNCLWLPQCV